MSFFDLTTIWLYFGWANQSLASITLWMATFYLRDKGKNYWFTLLPAGFIISVCITYIMYDKIGFNLPINISVAVGVILSLIMVIYFIIRSIHKYNISK